MPKPRLRSGGDQSLSGEPAARAAAKRNRPQPNLRLERDGDACGDDARFVRDREILYDAQLSHLVTNQTARFLTGLHEDGFNVILFGGGIFVRSRSTSWCSAGISSPRCFGERQWSIQRSSDPAFQVPAWPGLVDDRLPRCFGERGNWAGVFHLKAV